MKTKIKVGLFSRLLKTLFSFYPVLLPVTIGCIVVNAVVSSFPTVFMQKIIAVVEESWQSADWLIRRGRICSWWERWHLLRHFFGRRLCL